MEPDEAEEEGIETVKFVIDHLDWRSRDCGVGESNLSWSTSSCFISSKKSNEKTERARLLFLLDQTRLSSKCQISKVKVKN